MRQKHNTSALATELNFVYISIISLSYPIVAISGLILGLPPANERRRYKVTPSLIDWAQT